MTAQYKRKRLVTENSLDNKPKGYKLEGSERMRAKHIIHKELKDSDIDKKMSIARELLWEAESKMASECYEMELADPENYKCKCPKLEIEDFLD